MDQSDSAIKTRLRPILEEIWVATVLVAARILQHSLVTWRAWKSYRPWISDAHTKPSPFISLAILKLALQVEAVLCPINSDRDFLCDVVHDRRILGPA